MLWIYLHYIQLYTFVPLVLPGLFLFKDLRLFYSLLSILADRSIFLFCHCSSVGFLLVPAGFAALGFLGC